MEKLISFCRNVAATPIYRTVRAGISIQTPRTFTTATTRRSTVKISSRRCAMFSINDNETVLPSIAGVEFGFVPETNGVPLVADMSSNILTRPIDISKVIMNPRMFIVLNDESTGRLAVRCDLRWGSEEHRPGWSHVGDRSR